MPIYDYACDGCGQGIEIVQGFDDPAPLCPECGGPMAKRFLEVNHTIDMGRGYAASNGYAATTAQRGKHDRVHLGHRRIRTVRCRRKGVFAARRAARRRARR